MSVTIFQRRVDGAKRNPQDRVPVDSGGSSSASIHPTSSSTGDLIVTQYVGCARRTIHFLPRARCAPYVLHSVLHFPGNSQEKHLVH